MVQADAAGAEAAAARTVVAAARAVVEAGPICSVAPRSPTLSSHRQIRMTLGLEDAAAVNVVDRLATETTPLADVRHSRWAFSSSDRLRKKVSSCPLPVQSLATGNRAEKRCLFLV